MIKKSKKIKVWCDFHGKVPEQFKNQKRFRCPLCKRRLEIFIRPCDCCNPPSHTYWISKHKKVVKL